MSCTDESLDSSVIVPTSPCWVRSRRVLVIARPPESSRSRCRRLNSMFDTVSSLAYGWAMATLSRRPEPTSAKRAQIEARVLEATEALLAEGAAYSDLSIERIATRAGISRTAFYFYFHDRRELLMRLTEDVAELLYAEGDAWWSGDGDGPTELAQALRKVIALYRDHDVLLRAVVEAAAVDDAVAGFWRALVGRFVEASRRRIEAEQLAGRIGAMPA